MILFNYSEQNAPAALKVIVDRVMDYLQRQAQKTHQGTYIIINHRKG